MIHKSWAKKKSILDELASEKKIDSGFSEDEFKTLLELSCDLDDTIRIETARVLQFFSNKQEEELLIHLTKDKEWVVRAEACESLSLSENEEIIEYLIKLATRDRSGIVRGYAVTSAVDVALWLDVGETLVEPVKKMLEKEKSIFTRISLFASLIRLEEIEYLPALLDNLNTEKYQNRCATINCLIEIADENNFNEIRSALLKRAKIENSIAVKSSIDRCLNIIDKIEKEQKVK